MMFFVLFLFVFSCDDKIREEITEKYDDGKKKVLVKYKGTGSKEVLIEKILYSIILGGALGNVYDRIVYFAVPDFIDIHYQRFHWFTFNIADIFITIGIFLLIIKEFFLTNEKN